MGACNGQSGSVIGLCVGLWWIVDRMALYQVYVGVCGGQSGSVTGICVGLLWTEWHCNRLIWGLW